MFGGQGPAPLPHPHREHVCCACVESNVTATGRTKWVLQGASAVSIRKHRSVNLLSSISYVVGRVDAPRRGEGRPEGSALGAPGRNASVQGVEERSEAVDCAGSRTIECGRVIPSIGASRDGTFVGAHRNRSC